MVGEERDGALPALHRERQPEVQQRGTAGETHPATGGIGDRQLPRRIGVHVDRVAGLPEPPGLAVVQGRGTDCELDSGVELLAGEVGHGCSAPFSECST